MSDFVPALHRIREHGETLLAEAGAMLRRLVEDSCEVLGAAEGSILVPTDEGDALRFLVSLNPVLEDSETTVPIDRSISGYVYTTRQAVAKVHPETEGASKIDRLSRSQTSHLLAVPILDDDRVYGVATFVNRRGNPIDRPFSIEELRRAQAIGEIYATAMKLHRQIEFCTGMAQIEIAGHAAEFGVADFPPPSARALGAQRYRLPALLAERAADLPARECELLHRIGELVGEYAGSGAAGHDL